MKTILIISGRDCGKYGKLIKILSDGNISVRLEERVNIVVEKDNYVVVG